MLKHSRRISIFGSSQTPSLLIWEIRDHPLALGASRKYDLPRWSAPTPCTKQTMLAAQLSQPLTRDRTLSPRVLHVPIPVPIPFGFPLLLALLLPALVPSHVDRSPYFAFDTPQAETPQSTSSLPLWTWRCICMSWVRRTSGQRRTCPTSNATMPTSPARTGTGAPGTQSVLAWPRSAFVHTPAC